MNKNQTPQTSPVQDSALLNIDVNIYRPSAQGPVLADASVTIGGCFAIRGIKIREGKNGPFVSMPSRMSNGEYRDVCFPCTKEFKQRFDQTILGAYQQALTQSFQKRQGQYPGQRQGQYPEQRQGQYPEQRQGQYPEQSQGQYTEQSQGQYTEQSQGQPQEQYQEQTYDSPPMGMSMGM